MRFEISKEDNDMILSTLKRGSGDTIQAKSGLCLFSDGDRSSFLIAFDSSFP